MKKKVKKTWAKSVVKALDSYLRVDANTVSCICMNQPKAPKELSRYRRIK